MTITPEDSALAKQMIGSILIQRKVINSLQLDEALDMQKKEGGFLGEALVRLGYVDEKEVVAALVVQCSLPYIAINKYEIDPELLKLIPESMAREYLVIPLDRVGDVLSVVMVNPLSSSLKQDLEKTTGCRIATFIATKTEIQEAINRWYVKRK